jgi:hypothetical protein
MDWQGSGVEDDVPEDYLEIGSASDPAETLWAELTGDAKSMEDYIWSRDYIDGLTDFGHIGFTPQQLVEGMDRLKPRLYSIASSPDFEPGTVHLTVAIVRYNHHERDLAVVRHESGAKPSPIALVVIITDDCDCEVNCARLKVGAASNRVESWLEPVHALDELLRSEADVTEVCEAVDVVTRPDVVLHCLGILCQFSPECLGWIAG